MDNTKNVFNLQLSAFISETGILKNVKIITAIDVTRQLHAILIGKQFHCNIFCNI